jgi:phenylalanine-4-hydroxylase
MHALSPEEPVAYTAADQEVWALLYDRQLLAVQQYAYAHFARGLEQLGLTANGILSFTTLNERLYPLTGWKVYAVPGLIPNQTFFKFMVHKRFGATTWIRKREQLDYLEEPDMFHDVFGHVPLLADPLIANFLAQLALIAGRHLDNEAVIEAIARLYWYTIEFGLVRENGEPKIYGAGILSSIGETKFVLSPAANRVPFDLEQVLAMPYIKDKFQEQYFVLDTMEQLNVILTRLPGVLGE